MTSTTFKTTRRSDDSVAPDFPVSAKTANYTVVAGDVGKEFEFDSAAAVTCSLPAAATAGNGFNTILRNNGAGALTVDPDGAESIDGEASLMLGTDECYWIRSNGTSWGTLKPKGKPAFGPASTTENNIPQWDAQDTKLKDGLAFKDETTWRPTAPRRWPRSNPSRNTSMTASAAAE